MLRHPGAAVGRGQLLLGTGGCCNRYSNRTCSGGPPARGRQIFSRFIYFFWSGIRYFVSILEQSLTPPVTRMIRWPNCRDVGGNTVEGARIIASNMTLHGLRIGPEECRTVAATADAGGNDAQSRLGHTCCMPTRDQKKRITNKLHHGRVPNIAAYHV